jgi:acyl-CoA synthetase (AMP-forming)/AMP-acid ligase II
MSGLRLQNRVWTQEGPVSWRELLARGERRIAGVLGSEWDVPLAYVSSSPEEALEIAAAACAHDLEVAIIGRERLTDAVRGTLREAGLAIAVPDSPAVVRSRPPARGRVWILTSGTTGTPKLVQHTWETLLTVPSSLAPRRWLVPFQAGTYAWYQLVTPSLRVPEQELVVAPPGDVRDAIGAARTHGAEAISSTPTFWRVAFMTVPHDELRALAFAQISIGGEIVDQAILDQLQAAFPRARVSHIYAATEVGACIVVQDGRAGFPASMLDDERRRARLRIHEGRLWVKSANAGGRDTITDGWIDTGDLVERAGDRVFFKGRNGQRMINVGGQKVFPADVEAVLLAFPGVAWCRVEARRAPLVGNLVAAKIVPACPDDDRPLEPRVLEHCRDLLPEYAVPRFIELLEQIPLGGNLKSVQ